MTIVESRVNLVCKVVFFSCSTCASEIDSHRQLSWKNSAAATQYNNFEIHPNAEFTCPQVSIMLNETSHIKNNAFLGCSTANRGRQEELLMLTYLIGLVTSRHPRIT